MEPTLIVGIGGTGCKLIERLRRVTKATQNIDSLSLVDAATGQAVTDPKAPAIYIVSSLCGGTGAGLLPDLREIVPVHGHTVAEMLQHPDRLYRMSPHRFERFVGELYEGLGYAVTYTKRSHDGGVDLYLTRTIDGMTHWYVVQCKHSRKRRRRIGVGHTRELLGVATDRAATAAILVTNVFFSRVAKSFAARNANRLFCVDQVGLTNLMRDYLAVGRPRVAYGE